MEIHQEHEEEVAAYKAEIEDLQKQVDNLGDENRKLEQENERLKRKLSDLTRVAPEEPEPSETLPSMRETELEKKNAEMEAQLDELRAQLESSASASSELAKELADLKSMSQSANRQDSTECSFSGFSSDSIFLQDKTEFIRFVLAIKNGGQGCREYKQMYNFLLKCFTDADNNFDGRVGYLEFETLIDAAAFLPRRFGYAPSTPELYATDFDRVRQRLQLFDGLKPRKAKALDKKKQGTYDYISFDKWLKYAIGHIREKATLLVGENPHSKMLGTQEEFQAFVVSACSSRNSSEYKEMYHLILKCFVEADTDMDGLVDVQGLNVLLGSSSIHPRLKGLLPGGKAVYASPAEQSEARQKLFNELDLEGGLLSFDSWLEYVYTFICKTAKELGSAGVVPEIEVAGNAKSEPQCPWRV